MEAITLDIIAKIIMGGLIGYVFYNMKTMSTKIDKTMNETQVKEMIVLRGEKALILNQELKEDVKRLEGKLDKLIEISIKK